MTTTSGFTQRPFSGLNTINLVTVSDISFTSLLVWFIFYCNRIWRWPNVPEIHSICPLGQYSKLLAPDGFWDCHKIIYLKQLWAIFPVLNCKCAVSCETILPGRHIGILFDVWHNCFPLFVLCFYLCYFYSFKCVKFL